MSNCVTLGDNSSLLVIELVVRRCLFFHLVAVTEDAVFVFVFVFIAVSEEFVAVSVFVFIVVDSGLIGGVAK